MSHFNDTLSRMFNMFRIKMWACLSLSMFEKTIRYKKECPKCRTNLRNLSERISALVAELKQIIDPLKANVS